MLLKNLFSKNVWVFNSQIIVSVYTFTDLLLYQKRKRDYEKSEKPTHFET